MDVALSTSNSLLLDMSAQLILVRYSKSIVNEVNLAFIEWDVESSAYLIEIQTLV